MSTVQQDKDDLRAYIEDRGYTASSLLDGLQRQQIFMERLNELESDEELHEPERQAIVTVRHLSMF